MIIFVLFNAKHLIMKKLILSLLLIAPVMFTACSDDDNDKNNNGEENQTYTSFVVTNTNNADYENCVIGYFTKDRKCKKIADLGNLKRGDTSKEITVDYDVVKEMYFFTDTPSPAVMWSIPLKLEKGKKNTLKITVEGDLIFANPKDSTKYPH